MCIISCHLPYTWNLNLIKIFCIIILLKERILNVIDAVKFQTFKAKNLISRYAPKAEYQKETTGENDSQLEMTAKLELSYNDFIELKKYAESLGLIVFSTPFDMESVNFLDSINQKLWKIPSGEITNLPYLERIGSIDRQGKKIILSTGMATIDEIKKCIDILVKAGTNEEWCKD